MIKLIILCLFLIGCTKQSTYKEAVQNSKYAVGDIVLVEQGFYVGCKLTVETIRVLRDGTILYKGTSEDCPINIVIE